MRTKLHRIEVTKVMTPAEEQFIMPTTKLPVDFQDEDTLAAYDAIGQMFRRPGKNRKADRRSGVATAAAQVIWNAIRNKKILLELLPMLKEEGIPEPVAKLWESK